MTDSSGKVYLVGAGTGRIEHLTLQAHQLLTQAEVLIYDALVGDALLELTPSACLKLEVGKRGGEASTPQAEDQSASGGLLSAGKQVVRLKVAILYFWSLHG
ncbi:MAG: SAM-dependent methyltransferase [Leptolyngbya sp. IPPAS B-1204]